MAYTQTTLAQFMGEISSLMDDPGQVYWTAGAIRFATYEALYVWGAYTNYWRDRGVFNLDPTASPFYDLSTALPTLRTRTWTLDNMVKEIQYMLLENPSGIVGTGMTGQLAVGDILSAIWAGRNRFVQDVLFPLTVTPTAVNPPPPTGMVDFPHSTVFVHRAAWQDIPGGGLPGGEWTNLWRQDAWAADKGDQLWTISPDRPMAFSESENSPLKLQLIPPPVNSGNLEIVSADSEDIDLTNPNSTFDIPDEWIHAVKYSALSYILNGEGQIKDALRGQYAEQRYQQAVALAKDARSVIRVLCNNVPLPLDTLAAMDAGTYTWRNQTGKPEMAGVMYDMIVVNPGIPDQAYGMAADVVQSAPIPLEDTDYMPVGYEEMDHLTDYVSHLLVFQCGGKDFTSTMGGYDSFMSAVAGRKAFNAANIQYLTPLLGQYQKEEGARPDRLVKNA